MVQTPFERLSDYLQQQKTPFDVIHHAPVFTSEQAAEVRGTTLASGAKALICKADDRMVMIVLPADRKLASKQTRKEIGIKSLRFATREEVEQVTNLTPGSIPPFGSLFGLTTYCDARLAEQSRINFNAGDHSISISMSYDDYKAAEKPLLGTFAE
jgi:Ala-tRNA(Pro) deacylase